MDSDYIQELLNKVDALNSKVDALTAVVASQSATITKLTETVAIVSAENTALKARLNKNSKNQGLRI